MRIHALRIGETKVPYGQFYGGTEGWVGLRGMWRFLREKGHVITVPIYVYLVEHPRAGLILIDSGINHRQAHAHHEYYRGFVAHMTMDEDEYALAPEQELPAQLERLGHRPEDVAMVVMTHLHEDHLGGLLEVPNAKVVMAPPEWERVQAWNAGTRFLPPLQMDKLSPTIARMSEPDVVPFDSGPFHGFDRSQDLLGDGSITLLPTPGHTSGHLSVLVAMDGYRVLCTGDTLYTLRHLATDQVRPVAVGHKPWAQQAESIRRILQLRRELPDIVIAPAHDHTSYAHELLEPFLADGVLSEGERSEIRAYEQRVFGDDWRLENEALPRYVPSASIETAGTVTEPA